MGCGQGGRLLLLILFTCVEFLTICVHNFFNKFKKKTLVLKKRRKEKNKKKWELLIEMQSSNDYSYQLKNACFLFFQIIIGCFL